eukprot:scaffold62322_cov30-Phaeocystis_antarctica.AAC.1
MVTRDYLIKEPLLGGSTRGGEGKKRILSGLLRERERDGMPPADAEPADSISNNSAAAASTWSRGWRKQEFAKRSRRREEERRSRQFRRGGIAKPVPQRKKGGGNLLHQHVVQAA